MLSEFHIAIIGLGLMGGSLAMALRHHCAALYGIDHDPAVLALAEKRKVADRTSLYPEELLPLADIIILATPISAILETLHRLPQLHPGKAIVLDLGSTKEHITKAMQDLPSRFDPIGGHPMCGKEKSSLENADPAIFQGATFAFVPLERSSAHARALCVQLAQTIGAAPLWVDAQTHDRWSAATSHFPYLLSNALAAITPIEASPLVGPGFRSTVRLAATPPTLMRDVLSTNRHNILTRLRIFQAHLTQIENLLETGDFEAIENLLAQGAMQQQALLGSSSWNR